MTRAKFNADKLAKLKGATILEPVIDFSKDSEGYFGILIQLPNNKKKVIWFLSDDEGNGQEHSIFKTHNIP